LVIIGLRNSHHRIREEGSHSQDQEITSHSSKSIGLGDKDSTNLTKIQIIFGLLSISSYLCTHKTPDI
jgi:hypothetical protein